VREARISWKEDMEEIQRMATKVRRAESWETQVDKNLYNTKAILVSDLPKKGQTSRAFAL
jgi:hypothetical protein